MYNCQIFILIKIIIFFLLHQFQFISSIEKLSRDIPIANLPVNFGGQLHYNHDGWIDFRTVSLINHRTVVHGLSWWLLTCLSVNVYDPELHRKLWSGSSNVRGKRRSRSTRQLYKIAGQHSLNYPPSFLFRYLDRLVRSLVYLPLTQSIINDTGG